MTAFAAGRYSAPTEVRTETEVITRTQVVRTVLVDRRVETKWKRVIEAKPDGSSTTTEVGESVETEHSGETTKNEEVAASKETETTRRTDTNWQLGVLGGANWRPDSNVLLPTYGVTVGRRIIGPVWGNVVVLSNGTFAAGASLAF